MTKRTGVFPQMLAIAYDCSACGEVLGPFRSEGKSLRPTVCPSCDAGGTIKINYQRTEYGNYQKITLQESPGSGEPTFCYFLSIDFHSNYFI